MIKKDFRKKSIRSKNFQGCSLAESRFNECQLEVGAWWKILHLTLWVIAAITSGIFSVLSIFLLLFPFLFASMYEGSNNHINLGISSGAALSLIIFFYLVSKQGFIAALSKGMLFLFLPLTFGIILLGKSSQIGVSFFLGTGSLALAASSLIAIFISTFGLFLNFESKLISILLSSAISFLSAFLFGISLHFPTSFLFMTMTILVVENFITIKKSENHDGFRWIHDLTVSLSTIGGSSFQNADLSDADFTQAILKNVSLRNAHITRTRWFQTRGLEQTALGGTYLANPKIRQLVVSCNGQGHSFDDLDLTGVNLQDSNLQDASFNGVSLNQSNLRGADLSRAILKQTQLDRADLTGAILTGAYIEDWGITSTTKLENVQCEYVYMRVPTKENPNPLRKPDNLRETFAEGEFADFIQPFFDTLDLYHSQDIDPRAISIALRNLSASHPDDNLQFVAMERRGSNGLNLRFTTAPRANKSELSHEYFTKYAQIKKELPVAVQMKLAEQDAEIRTLKGTIEQFIQIGTHQSTIQAKTIQVIQGELVMTENRGIHINAGDNVNITGLSSGDGVVNLGTINGNVTNAINQLPEAPELDQPNLKELLTQLQQAIQADVDLPDPDKSDLLEQVQALAEAKQIEEPAKREGLMRKAMKMFDATLKNLPDTAKIAEACSKLLPLILKALGFPG